MTRGDGATANTHPSDDEPSRPVDTSEQTDMSSTSPAIRLLALSNISESKPPLAATGAASAAAAQKDALPAPSSTTRGRRAYYTSAQWTADGTSLLATSSSPSHSLSPFVLPADLLHPAGEPPIALRPPRARIRLPEPTQVAAPAPYFSLAEPMTQLVLVGCRDHPLQLYHAFTSPDDDEEGEANSAAGYSYKLIRRESEEYITPASLLWEEPGTHFVCGSANRLDYFDLSRHGSDGPILTIPTIPSRRHISKGHGVGMKGTVAALSASPPDAANGSGGSILAAGTWTRWMGLYDLHRTDKVVANWSVAGAEADFQVDMGGQGIVQTSWSPCGRYLLVNERQAQGLLVYDIRVTGQLLCVLRGRKSTSQQRLRCDVFPGEGGVGFEVWAGGQDGRVSVYEAVGSQNDVLDPSWEWKAHDSPVGGTAVHPSGSVVATCSGGWDHLPVEDLGHSGDMPCSGKVLDESSIKIWSIG